jgi:DNA (cytosine-5)-methyltransferase 1
MIIGSLFTGTSGLEKELLKNSNNSLAYVSDIDKWCSSLLKHHHPDVPNFGSIIDLDIKSLPDVDIIMGGTSCQNFSYQGDRGGLKGSKSKLFYDFIRVIKQKQPKYVLWENVKGASTHNDFTIIKQLFKEIGYEIDYNIFNSREYAPTIQQRERIFMLATNQKYDKVRLNCTIPNLQLNEEMQNIKRRLVSISKSHREKHIDVRINNNVANTLVTGWGCSGMSTKNYINEDGTLRDLNIHECEQLMTWEKDFTKYGKNETNETIEIPLKNRYKMCGNGVVSKVVPHILSNLDV